MSRSFREKLNNANKKRDTAMFDENGNLRTTIINMSLNTSRDCSLVERDPDTQGNFLLPYRMSTENPNLVDTFTAM